MRIIIAGAGQVGTRVASALDGEHEIVLIDTDTERTDRLRYDLDVLTVTGDSSAIETLREAGIEDADLLIASTDSDEINILTCGTAKALSDVTTVARVKSVKYLTTWDEAENVFDVDFMVGTNLLAVAAAVGGSGLSAARNFDVFAGGTVQMAEFAVGETVSITDQTVSEADRFDSLTIAAILRDGTTIIPSGSTRIKPGDSLVVIGAPEVVHEFGVTLSGEDDARNVLIIGGSDIAYQIASQLEGIGFRPRIVASEYDRSRELSERLSESRVRHKDPREWEFLDSERIEDVDVAVAAIEEDSEANLLAALRTKRNGADRSVAVVDHAEYVELFEDAGVDVAVNPRRATAREIIEFVRNRDTQHVALLDNEQAQVIEIEIGPDSVLVGRPLSESAAELPDRVVIGAITRNGSFLAPRGETVLEPGDHAVVFTDTDVVDDVLERI